MLLAKSNYWLVFSPNKGKYGPEKPPYLDTFHKVYYRYHVDYIYHPIHYIDKDCYYLIQGYNCYNCFPVFFLLMPLQCLHTCNLSLYTILFGWWNVAPYLNANCLAILDLGKKKPDATKFSITMFSNAKNIRKVGYLI